ncbi:MAG: hypothetical protein DRP01_01260 [Archaeoglobales archaeon]|nr:MAG: hypothetical protein DRP01_01260 [Archaeoglobales archaeon]
MKWKELFDEWLSKNKDVIVRTEGLADSAVSSERLKKNVAVWYKNGDAVVYRVIHAWVFNPQTETEEAFWEGSEPILTSANTFRAAAVKKLEELKTAGTIIAYRIESVDESARIAFAYTYTKTTEGVREERVLIVETEGQITVEKII